MDSEGRLHLSLRFRDGLWWSSEVILMESHGFGTYSLTTESDLDGLDPNIVFGAFLWDAHGDENSVFAGSSNREIDSEDSRWSNPSDPNGSQWAIAPYYPAGSVRRYALPDLGSPPFLSRSIDWSADKIVFTALAGQHTPCDQVPADLIDGYVFQQDPVLNRYVPDAGRERFRFNLWMLDAGGPTDGQEIEVVITDMTFYPSGDTDCDTVAQASDNCSAVANPDQADDDFDGIGNACDLRITTTSLPSARAGSFYSQFVTAEDGTPPYTFMITDGAPPFDTSMDPATGEISGEVQSTFLTFFTVQVTDSAGDTATQALSIRVTIPNCVNCHSTLH